MSSLNEIAEEYFGNINSMANRMWIDMKETRSQYKQTWNKLKDDEKNRILNDSIINPNVQVKYRENNGNANKVNHNNYATKIIVDDNNCSYDDEHSGPFSFRTKSQRDLTFCNNDKMINLKKTAISKDESIAKPKPIIKTVTDNTSSFTILDNMYSMQSMPRTGLDLLDNW